MMWEFLRNSEIRNTLLLHAVICFLAVLGAFLLFREGIVFTLVLCLGFLAVYYISTYRRYQKLKQLSCDIDRILHGKTEIRLEEYREGEFAVLQNEIQKMTSRLMEQAECLKKDKKYLADAMADISHQLRTPLTSAELIVNLLKNPDLSYERRMMLEQELSQLLTRTGWLIETLLKMSKLDSQTAYLKKKNVFVKELLQKAAEPLLIPMELHGQTLLISGVSKDCSFQGDFSWSVEAISNILKNCMEHIAEDGTIQVTASANTLFTEMIIEDDGQGFAEKDLSHIFERFYKGENATSQSIGIGLALSRMIIVRQNGTIKAENKKTGGARFTIRFYTDATV